MKTPKYPNIVVKLTGIDGNAFSLLGICTKAARKEKLEEDEINSFLDEAMSGDYNKLLKTCKSWFTIK